MAKFSFTSFNKERLFNVDTSDFDYKKLEDLYNENGEDYVYPITGVYIGTKSKFAAETPIVATDDCYVNLPDHQLGSIKEMLASKQAVDYINSGAAGFMIEKYHQKRFDVDCYSAVFVDYNEAIADVD